MSLSKCYSSLLDSMNAEIRIRWLQIVVRNDYYPDLHRVRRFLESQVRRAGLPSPTRPLTLPTPALPLPATQAGRPLPPQPPATQPLRLGSPENGAGPRPQQTSGRHWPSQQQSPGVSPQGMHSRGI